ncbi:MAG: enterochelin esterase [Planctomycetaceae bacterium]|nr:enterochelin esterase [Planctomycetota bacterium]NUN51441.1 enterochelin esterase [Planctomycetaceae bacterium]
MTLAVLQLIERHETLSREDVDRFLAEHGSPIVEGPTITFLFRGEADGVRLRHFVFGLPSARPFQRILGTDLWYCSVEVPRGSRIEYKLEVDQGGRTRLVRDPLNPRNARDPYGSNSVCHGAGYEAPEWIRPDPEARPGDLADLVVPSTGPLGERPVKVYTPARMRTTRRYPLLVVFDGEDYLRYAGMKTVLDNLVHRYDIAPMVAAFTQSEDRFRDYGASRDHADWVVRDLLPFLEARLPLRDDPADRCLMGASLGAVASLSAAWRHQGVFGRLLLQSGSFAFTDIGREAKHPALEPVVEFVNGFRAEPGMPAEKIFVSCGVYESLIYENRSLVPLLERTGMEIRFVESRDGHNWENWRDRLREGLGWLFPGPMALVYE